jgi:hypothetical protein
MMVDIPKEIDCQEAHAKTRKEAKAENQRGQFFSRNMKHTLGRRNLIGRKPCQYIPTIYHSVRFFHAGCLFLLGEYRVVKRFSSLKSLT